MRRLCVLIIEICKHGWQKVGYPQNEKVTWMITALTGWYVYKMISVKCHENLDSNSV